MLRGSEWPSRIHVWFLFVYIYTYYICVYIYICIKDKIFFKFVSTNIHESYSYNMIDYIMMRVYMSVLISM